VTADGAWPGSLPLIMRPGELRALLGHAFPGTASHRPSRHPGIKLAAPAALFGSLHSTHNKDTLAKIFTDLS
jgi:hypothetical protein